MSALADAKVPSRMNAAAPLPLVAKFAHVDAWVFDLDNTLYPFDCGLWPQIEERITLFLIEHSGLDGASAMALQRYYYRQHGTTLGGLVKEDGISPEGFLDFVHNIDRSGLAPNPRLGEEIAKLPGRKLIFTNGSRGHALATVEQLGLTGLFEGTFDIVASGLVPKPLDAAFDSFFRAHGVEPTRAAMFEDIAKNLVVPRARGMTTVLVRPKPGGADHRQMSDQEPAGSQVDFTTDDLSGLLAEINAELVR